MRHIIDRLSVATPDTIRQELLSTVKHLLLSIRGNAEVLEELRQVRELLDSLPLATDEYGTAANRIRNGWGCIRYIPVRTVRNWSRWAAEGCGSIVGP